MINEMIKMFEFAKKNQGKDRDNYPDIQEI
jgi:hypothetical protein